VGSLSLVLNLSVGLVHLLHGLLHANTETVVALLDIVEATLLELVLTTVD
jgi:hypothetical protein